MSLKNQFRWNKRVHSNSSPLAVHSLVLPNAPNVPEQAYASSKKHSRDFVSTLEQISASPPVNQNASIAGAFVRSLLTSKGFSDGYSKHVSKYTWRQNSIQKMGPAMKRWVDYCTLTEKNAFDLDFEDILDFLFFSFTHDNHTFSMLTQAKSTLLEMRRLSGNAITEIERNHISKFLKGCFNREPPIKKAVAIWDVNILLKYFRTMGENNTLQCNKLAGKAVLLIMLSTMCRKQEILQFRISCMRMREDSCIFTLPEPTKTYTPDSYRSHPMLQTLSIV